MSSIGPRNNPPEPPEPPEGPSEPIPWKRVIFHLVRMLLIGVGVLLLLVVIVAGIILGTCMYGRRF